MRKVILALFIMPSVLMWAQDGFLPGYIITNDHDTIHGYIHDRSETRNFKRCEFRETAESEPIFYEPGTISGYRFSDGRFYVSKTVKSNETLFVEYLVDGEARLYYYRDYEGPRYLIEKEGKLAEISRDKVILYEEGREDPVETSENQQGVLNYMFSDCMEIQPELEFANLTHSSMIKLTQDYHGYVCEEGEECIVYQKELLPIRFGIAPVAGYRFASIRMADDPYLQFFEFTNANYPVIGFSASMTPSRKNHNITLHLETEFGHMQSKGAYIETYTFRTEYHHLDLAFSFLKIPVAFKYILFNGKVRPSFMFGAHYNFILNSKLNGYVETVHSDGEIERKDSYVPDFERQLAGIFARIGIHYYLHNGDHLFLNAGYETSIGIAEEFSSYLSSFGLQAGYFF